MIDYENESAFEISEKLEEALLSDEDIWETLQDCPVNTKTLKALLSVLKSIPVYEIYDKILFAFKELLSEQEYDAIMSEYRQTFTVPLSFEELKSDIVDVS